MMQDAPIDYAIPSAARPPSRARSWLIWIAVVVLIVAGGVQVIRKTLHASLGYTVESQFASLPANDTALIKWLQSQPGIVSSTVSVERVGGGGTVLRVFFIQSRDLTSDPPFPDLDGACSRLGYSSPVYKFRDSSVP